METFIVPLLVLLALGAGLAFVWGAPIFGIPLLVLALIVGAAWLFGARVKRASRFDKELEHATSDGPGFTARDHETLTHEQP
jgi:Flp pilus assembly protein TadB